MEEEPGGLLSMGSQRVGHDWATSLSLFSGWQFLLNSIKHWVIFPTQAWNPGLLHCREILYLLSHQEAQSSGDKLIFKEQRSLIFLSSCYFPNVSHKKLHFKCSPVAGWVWEIQDLIHVKYIDSHLAGGVYYLNVSPFVSYLTSHHVINIIIISMCNSRCRLTPTYNLW